MLLTLGASSCSLENLGDGLPTGSGESDDGGSGGSGGGGGGGDPGDPGDPTLSLEQGATVAALEVVIPPGSDWFTLRGTVPLPKGVYHPAAGFQPFGVVDASGETYSAQAEVVSWYPADGPDGADVVEIIARVSRGPHPFGTRATYHVVLAEHPGPVSPGTPGVEDLLAGPLAVPTAVQSLLSNPTAIEIRSYDCFGNLYTAHPLDGTAAHKLLRYGEHVAELRAFQHLAPDPPVSGSKKTLAHWLGVHSYVSTWNDEEIVGFDLRVTNADSGVDGTTTDDDPLGKVYFRTLEIAVPAGWTVVQDFDDPYLGAATSSGGMTVVPIVDDLSGGKMHVIAWGGQFHRRLAVCRIGDEDRARGMLRGDGLGFARKMITPDGNPAWSWWNPSTARYLPQAHLIPVLEHVGQAGVASKLEGDRDGLQAHLENGTSQGVYPVLSPVLGWAHPYGVEYGGMTGGSEIHIFEGVDTAWAAEIAGYQTYRMLHRMHTDRMANALYNADGEPSSVDDWVTPGPSGLYVPFEHFIKPTLSGTDAFGVSQADPTHVDHVASAGLAAPYESALTAFAPHDYQHFSRYTRSARALTWLANDSVAKDDLRMQASNFQLSYHPYNNGPYGGKQVTGMAADQEFVSEHPGKSFPIGRGEGWGLDCANAAYTSGDAAWRARFRPWYDDVVQLLFDGQGACNGFLQGQVGDKMLDGKYRARQAIEHAILDNGVRGMLERVYRDEDVAYQAMLEQILRDSYYALISDMSWGPGKSAPWQYTAVGPKDPSTVYCSLGQMPTDGKTDGSLDKYQDWSDLAYGYEVTGDDEFLDKAALQIGGATDLLGALENDGLDNLANRAALIALMQELEGVL